MTDKDGGYNFEATYPGVYTQRPIPHVHFKVFTKHKEFSTQLYFQDDVPPDYEDYVQGRETQLPQEVVYKVFSSQKIHFRSVTFTITIEE